MKSVTSDGTFQIQLVKEGQQQLAILHQNSFTTLVIGNINYTKNPFPPVSIPKKNQNKKEKKSTDFSNALFYFNS